MTKIDTGSKFKMAGAAILKSVKLPGYGLQILPEQAVSIRIKTH